MAALALCTSMGFGASAYFTFPGKELMSKEVAYWEASIFANYIAYPVLQEIRYALGY